VWRWYIANYLRSILLGFPIGWSHFRRYQLPSSREETLGPYYVEWDPGTGIYGEDWTVAPRDEKGVIVTKGIQKYHPVQIARYGLYNYNVWVRTRSASARSEFLTQAHWLRDNQVERLGVGGCYPLDYPLVRFGADVGWISAMAQGVAISLLLRAAEHAPNDGFVDAALLAAEPFKHEIVHGGVVWKGETGVQFFEEVAVSPPSHILSGHIYALWGLYDLLNVRDSENMRQIAAAGNRTLRLWLPLFDSEHWSYYMLLGTSSGYRNFAQLKYHALHIAQLRVTAAFTGDEYYGEIADRWEEQTKRMSSRFHLYANSLVGLVPRFTTHADSVPGGARSIVDA